MSTANPPAVGALSAMTAQQLIESVETLVAEINGCRWETGRLAHIWKNWPAQADELAGNN